MYCTGDAECFSPTPTYVYILYSRKSSRGLNFHNFCDPWLKRENKNREHLNTWTFCTCENFSHMRFAYQSCCLTMALYRYLKPADNNLPSPTGHLSSSVSPVSIKAANEAARESALTPTSKSRGTHAKYTPTQQAMIGEYASIHGNLAAVRPSTKKLGVEVKESSVRTWKVKYRAEIEWKKRGGDKAELCVEKLPVKKRGRPLLLGEKLDDEVKCYIRAVWERGGVITTTITMAAATAIVRRSDRNLLSENGGSISITPTGKNPFSAGWILSSKRVVRPRRWQWKISRQLRKFILNIRAVVEMEDIPPELVFNWDQMEISIVPGSSWTMEVKGSKWVEIAGMNDKRQITAVFCGTLAEEFLPPHLIYQEKTSACLLRYQFPDD